MRFYSFTNFYMSSIQNGIQSGHCISELFVKYDRESTQGDMLFDWAENHKTMIVLNGGQSSDLRDLVSFMDNEHNLYPWSVFYEEKDALDGAITSVAIILPMRFYQCAAMMRTARPGGPYNYDAATGIHRFFIDDENGMRVEEFSAWEGELMQRMNGAPLAR